MSLILDALKRAERERKLGQAPAALEEVAVPVSSPTRNASRRPLVLGAVAAVLAGLAAVAYLRSGSGDAALEPAPEASLPTAASAQIPAASAASPQAALPPAPEPMPEPTIATTDPAAALIEGSDDIVSLDDLTGAPAAMSAEPSAEAFDDERPTSIVAAAPPSEVLIEPAPPRPAPPAPPATQAIKLQPKPVTTTSAKPSAAAAPAMTVDSGPLPVRATVVRVDGDGNPISISPPAVLSSNDPLGADEKPIDLPTPSSPVAAALDAAPSPVAPRSLPPTGPAAPVPARPAVAARPANPAPAAVPPPSPYAGTPKFKEMPPSFRAEFPTVTIDVHAYNSEPQRRFVLVNGRRYREGDALSEGPRILQIVSDGIVFDWRGQQVLYGSR